MSGETQNITVRMTPELVDQVEEAFPARGFGSRSEFIRTAVRNALAEDDPFTDEARAEIEAAREAYEDGETKPVNALLKQAGLDPLPEPDAGSHPRPELYDEEQDTWVDETDVTIVGLGGAGADIVSDLHEAGLSGADTVVIDTEEDDLENAVAHTRLHLQLPTGEERMDPVTPDGIQKLAAKSKDRLQEQLFSTSDLVFVVSGIGGSAGAGLTPVVCQAAADAGAVVTTLSTLPHTLEHERRLRARDEISTFHDVSDTFVLLDAARFTEVAVDLMPGEVFEAINEYIVTALIGMVHQREYFGQDGTAKDFDGLASLFADGGYATIATSTAAEAVDVEIAIETLFSRSLVDTASDTTGQLVHFVRYNPRKLSDPTFDALFDRPSSLSPLGTHINILADEQLPDAVRITSIITGLDVSSDDLIEIPAETDETETTESGGFALMPDNTEEATESESDEQEEVEAAPVPSR